MHDVLVMTRLGRRATDRAPGRKPGRTAAVASLRDGRVPITIHVVAGPVDERTVPGDPPADGPFGADR